MTNKKELWEIYPEVWKTQSEFFVWLRGGLRRALWEKYPPKIIFKNKTCQKPPDGLVTRAKTGAYCALSGEWTGKSALEVDHIVGNASLRCWDDVLTYILHLCTTSDNMQLVSKKAHKIKSYAERMGLDYEDAAITKEVIEIEKQESLDSIKQFLYDYGYSTEQISTAKKRRSALIDILTNVPL